MAVTKFGVRPPDFWTMPPKHFWWLVETLDPPSSRGLDEADRRAIGEALRGNGKGAFW
ncbi:MAG: hypothetical protein ACRCTG_13330 [Aestuariivirga sp.]